MKICEDYSREYVHFLDKSPPEKLITIFDGFNKRKKKIDVVDIGCGDGAVLYALQAIGLLRKAKRVVGVDLSEDRCREFERNVEGAVGIAPDGTNVRELENESFDIVICTQVIEHVAEDILLLREIHRILKKDGIFFISTVFRRWYGFYFYRNEGKIVLDPMHVREYNSRNQFLELLKQNGFEVSKVKVSPVEYPLIDLVIRGLIKLNLVKPQVKIRNIYIRHRLLSKVRAMLKIPILGYYNIEATCTKNV